MHSCMGDVIFGRGKEEARKRQGRKEGGEGGDSSGSLRLLPRGVCNHRVSAKGLGFASVLRRVVFGKGGVLGDAFDRGRGCNCWQLCSQ